jgi:exosortase A
MAAAVPTDGQDLAAASGQSAWLPSLSALILGTAAFLLVFHRDVAAAVGLWIDIPTYNYCFLIPLISLVLAWRRRTELARLSPVPSSWGIAVVAVFAALWWTASAALITEARQLAIVGMLQGLALGLLGWTVYRRLAFPLLYLFLTVPTGTVLLGLLQSLTTAVASAMLRMSGLPVFVQGNVIEVPHGVYLVAPGCAGLNFLLAALALTLLYGSSVYSGVAKRVACVAAGLLISILANQVRVFGIIGLAEITQRQMDIVNDHLFYGWVFFMAVIMASMAIGLKFADPPRAPAAVRARPLGRPRPAALAAVCLAILGVAGGAQASYSLPFADAPDAPKVIVTLPDAVAGWRQVAPTATWSPEFAQADLAGRWAFARNGRRIDVFIAYYWQQSDGHKATDMTNDLVGPGRWTRLGSAHRTARIAGTPLDVTATRLAHPTFPQRLVWSWYWLAGRQTADPLMARLLGVPARLRGDARAAAVALAIDEGPDPAEAEALLADFLAAGPFLSDALQQARLQGN